MSQDAPRQLTAQASGPRRRLLAGFLVAVAVAACGVVWHHNRRQPAPQLPELDLAGIDPEVAAALQDARDAVAQKPRAAEAWGLLARRLHACGFYPQALACYAEAERLEPTSATWPYLHAVILLAGPAPAEAIPLLQTAVERDRGATLPRLRLGEVLLEEGRVEEATEQLRAVLARDPGEPRAHFRLAQVAASRQEWQDCLRHVNATAALSARKQACALRLRAYEALGDGMAAQTEQRALAELPDDPPWPDAITDELIWFELGLRSRGTLSMQLCRDGKLQEARLLLEDTVRKYPDSAMAWDRLGRVRAALQQFPEAEQAWRRSLELAPDTGETWLYLGLMRLECGKLDEALAALRTAARLRPFDASTRCKIGACLAAKGDLDGAAAAYREALRLQPDLAEAREALARTKRP